MLLDANAAVTPPKSHTTNVLRAIAWGILIALISGAVQSSAISRDPKLAMNVLLGDLLGGIMVTVIHLLMQLRYQRLQFARAIAYVGMFPSLYREIHACMFSLCACAERSPNQETSHITRNAVEQINSALQRAMRSQFLAS